jgi:hypothetical protein
VSTPQATVLGRRTKPLPEPHLARLQKRMARGQSLEEAAEGVGLTLPLAKSVFIRAGLPVPKPYRHRKPRHLGRQIHDYLKDKDTATSAEVAAAVGATTVQVRDEVWEVDEHKLVGSAYGRERYPDAAVLLGLRLLSLRRGQEMSARGMVPLTISWWDAHRDPLAHPPAAEVRRRWGSWRAACEAAGVPVRRVDKPMSGGRRFTDADLEAVLREFFASGADRSIKGYAAWAAERPDTPSFTTLVQRLGSWNALRDRYQP